MLGRGEVATDPLQTIHERNAQTVITQGSFDLLGDQRAKFKHGSAAFRGGQKLLQPF